MVPEGFQKARHLTHEAVLNLTSRTVRQIQSVALSVISWCLIAGIMKLSCPKCPRTKMVCTLAPKYLYRDYFKAKVYPIWVHALNPKP